MKHSILLLTTLFLFTLTIYAQETKIDSNMTNKGTTNKVYSPQGTGDAIQFLDEDTNELLKVIDEGSFGSLELKSGVPTTTTNKLYNNSGTLNFNGTALGAGGASVIDQLGDAIYDGSSLFIGEGAGGTEDDGANSNTAVGKNALSSNTSGYRNTANGYYSLYSNTEGNNNTANGSFSLRYNTTGDNNTANGYYSLYSNTIGNNNNANGYYSLYSNTEGNNNTANGYYSLYANRTGSYNTANGYYSLWLNTTGDYNTAIGYNAGPTSGNYSNTTALGNGAVTSASNTIAIGNSSITSIKGQVAFSTFSDGRYKFNVREDVAGLDFILGLRPITYNVDVNTVAEKLKEDVTIDENGNTVELPVADQIASARIKKSSMRNSGFIAQEVEELANNLDFDFSGIDAPQNEESMYALRYAEFVVPLVKAVQEQQEMITKQEELVKQQGELISRLEDRIKDLEINSIN